MTVTSNLLEETWWKLVLDECCKIIQNVDNYFSTGHGVSLTTMCWWCILVVVFVFVISSLTSRSPLAISFTILVFLIIPFLFLHSFFLVMVNTFLCSPFILFTLGYALCHPIVLLSLCGHIYHIAPLHKFQIIASSVFYSAARKAFILLRVNGVLILCWVNHSRIAMKTGSKFKNGIYLLHNIWKHEQKGR